jgi:hypothetical protein
MVAELVGRLPGPPRHVFVCGGNPFVEAASQGTIEADGLAVSAADEPGGAELCSFAPADWSALR